MIRTEVGWSSPQIPAVASAVLGPENPHSPPPPGDRGTAIVSSVPAEPVRPSLAHLQAVPDLLRDRLPSCHALCKPADVQQNWPGAAEVMSSHILLPAGGLLG